MKLIGILLSLAILAYAISTYLDSSGTTTTTPERTYSKPKDYTDHAQQNADAINKTLQRNKERLDNLD